MWERYIKKSLQVIRPYIPGRPIEEVKRELGLRHVVKLASNENPYPPSPKVIQAMAKAAQGVNRYPDGGCFELRKLLAERLRVDTRQLIFGNGSDELIVLVVRALVKDGDEVVMAKPSFLIYSIASQIAGAKLKEVPLRRFHYDLDAMQKAINKKTRVIFLGNPDNPSGTYLTQKAMDNFMATVPIETLVFMDEAYFEYVTADDYVDSIGLLAKYPNVIVSRTFSKLYGLAGLRIGYAAANLELISYLERLREPFNVNSVAQAAAVACLKDKAYYRQVAKDIDGQRKVFYQELDRLDVRYEKSFTNFILIATSLSGREMTQELLRKGVIVRDMTGWGLHEYIRVSIGSVSENKKFFKALRQILNQ